MTSSICGAALVLTIGAAAALAGRSIQNDSVQPAGLNARIGPANPQRYKPIHESNKWQNPYLVIRRDGIEVISNGIPPGRRTVASIDLRRILIDLPVSAWPYGKVVAVQDIGILVADLSDGQQVADNRHVTLAILKTLDITVEEWPSA
jgi:hypothetical protein